MTEQELRSLKAPVYVQYKGKLPRSLVTGFSQNDPLGVGGGMFPDMPVCYFKNGGWLLVTDLLRHYEVSRPFAWAGIPTVDSTGEPSA